MFAALGLLARSHGLDDNAHILARQTLLRMDADSLRWWWDDGNLPDELKGLHNIFAPEAAGVWQVAYWMGVSQGGVVAFAQSAQLPIIGEGKGWEENV